MAAGGGSGLGPFLDGDHGCYGLRISESALLGPGEAERLAATEFG